MRRNPFSSACSRLLRTLPLICLFAVSSLASAGSNWWDDEFTIRKKITLDASSKGAAIVEPIGSVAVLLRLHDGNFQFVAAKEDGGDLRFVAADGKTPLADHI